MRGHFSLRAGGGSFLALSLLHPRKSEPVETAAGEACFPSSRSLRLDFSSSFAFGWLIVRSGSVPLWTSSRMQSVRWGLRRLCLSRRVGFYGYSSKGFLPGATFGALPSGNPAETHSKVLDCREYIFWSSRGLHDIRYQIHTERKSTDEGPVDPFALVSDELSIIANRLRSMVVSEVPKLASAAEYFFKVGVEGKRFRPTVLLLMASALNMPTPESVAAEVATSFQEDMRTRQQCLAEIAEMIHVASLLHDDVLDDANTRRGIGSLNFIMGNKLAVLAGDFLLSRACVALASLKNTEVVTLFATILEHLVTGETMQMTTKAEQRRSMDYYLLKTYYKTASLVSNSCKAVALLAGQTAEVAMLAYDYGRNLGLAFQLIDDVLDFTGTTASLGKGSLSDIRHGIITAPILFAMEEFPELHAIVDKGFEDPANVDAALEYLAKSKGIEKTRELAVGHANRAIEAIDALPESDDEDVLLSRRALVDLTQMVITRSK